MNLVLDLGNSRCKWALARPPGMAEVRSAKPSVNEASFTGQTQEQVFRDAGLTQGGALAYGEDFAHALDNSFHALPRPEHVAAVCVAATGNLQTLAQWVQSRWGLELQPIVTRAAQLGVTNSYKDPTRLGADRWAALVAARARLPGAACVVDCGTALTIDALDQSGVYRGGVILPGLALMRDALLRTQGVRDVLGDAGSPLAQSTADGVAAGTLFGLAGAIDRILDEQAALLGDTPQTLITGGDAPPLLALLRHVVQHTPDLVLEGVARIARAGGAA
ncbi:MAG: type III pantothenate kinase [Pseudomonadota bacterium]